MTGDADEVLTPRPPPQAWTAEQIHRAARHLGPSAERIALALVDVLRDPPREWRR